MAEPRTCGQNVLVEPSPTTAQQIDEDFLHQLMFAELGDIQSQLDAIMVHPESVFALPPATFNQSWPRTVDCSR